MISLFPVLRLLFTQNTLPEAPKHVRWYFGVVMGYVSQKWVGAGVPSVPLSLKVGLDLGSFPALGFDLFSKYS